VAVSSFQLNHANLSTEKMPLAERVLIVDDHPLIRAGLKAIFEDVPDIEVVGAAASVAEAIEQAVALLPDLVVSDMTLLERSGFELIKDLRSLHPRLPVLIISMHDERIYAERVLRAGGRGYLMKDTPPDQIIKAVRTILRGGVYVSTETTKRFLETLSDGAPATRFRFPLERLTDRELEIFELISQGKNSHEIAAGLHISPRTVDAHRTHIRTKLRLPDSNALLAYSIKWKESDESGEPLLS
jgi:DNA-binding NarL/FixJ family response regulator